MLEIDALRVFQQIAEVVDVTGVLGKLRKDRRWKRGRQQHRAEDPRNGSHGRIVSQLSGLRSQLPAPSAQVPCPEIPEPEPGGPGAEAWVWVLGDVWGWGSGW